MQKIINTMKHVHVSEFGAPSVLVLKESPLPILKENEVLVEIMATSINRADTLQRQGKYPSPKGTTDILGLECAGFVLNQDMSRGKKVMTILPGGGYAQYVAVNKNHLIEIPENIDFGIAGGIAEVYLTAYLQIKLANMKQGNSCLIYAAASGVGQATMQICNHYGINTIASCSKDKHNIAAQYTKNIIDRHQDIEQQVKQIKQICPQGVDAVFDCVGQQNHKITMDSLGMDGRWILYGLISGGMIQNFNLAQILAKRIQLIPSTLRSRSDEFKSNLVNGFIDEILPLLKSGQIVAPVDRVVKIKWDEEGIGMFRKLHEDMESNKNAGKMNVLFEYC